MFETGGYASQTLSAAPVLKKYVRDIVLPMSSPDLEGPINSFLLACEVVEIVGNVNRGASPTQLDNATTAWMRDDDVDDDADDVVASSMTLPPPGVNSSKTQVGLCLNTSLGLHFWIY